MPCSADAANKGGMRSMEKKVASLYYLTDSIFVFTIDSNAQKDANKRVAKAIDTSLIKLDCTNYLVILINILTDSRGGRACIGLKAELVKLERMKNKSSYYSYSIYRLNLPFINPITKFCRIGGVKDLNSLQVVFISQAIEQEFELGTWQNMQLSINNETYS